jgi:circadian clock protein KaiC
MERVKTGVEGLDQALNGGIPKGNVVLVSGSAGTGKTLLCLSFVYYGATKFKEPGIYVSTDQTEEELRAEASNFGWDLEALEKKKMLKLYHVDVTKEEDLHYLQKIDKIAKEIKAKRIALDSLTTLTEFLAPVELKKGTKLFEVLDTLSPVAISESLFVKNVVMKIIKHLKATKCTCMLTSELPEEGNWLSRDTVSEFLVDGVITLRPFKYARSDIDLVVVKLRYGSHSKDLYKIYITEKGVEVKPAEKGIVVPKL